MLERRHGVGRVGWAVRLAVAAALATMSTAIQAGPSAPLAAAAVLPTVVTYTGRSGSFGTVGTTTPTDSVTTQSVSIGKGSPASWAFRSGQAAWFTTLASNGDLVLADQPQTDNPTRPTADHMAVSTFRPGAGVNPATGTLTNHVVPTTTGSATALWPGKPVGGADIEDVQLVPASGSRPERIAFTSAVPYSGWDASTTGEYPVVGFLERSGSGWTVDGYASGGSGAGVSRTAGQLAASTTDTALADATCPVVFFLRDCGGLNEIARLPNSGNLVVTQYFGTGGSTSGGIVILSPEGQLLARYAYPVVHDESTGTATVKVRPREVKADPTAPAGTDRFVVLFDTFDGNDAELPFAVQEFGYTPAGGITPTTYAFRADHSTDIGFESALYDSAGNLWLAQRHRASLTAAPLARYSRTELALCAPQWGWWDYYGHSCAPRDAIASSANLGYTMSLDEDPITHDILNTTLSGYLQSVRRTTGTTAPYAFTQRLVISLGINNLRDRTQYLISPRKATVDGTNRRYYIPVQLIESAATTGPGCGWWKSPPVACTPTVLDQWLVTIDLQSLLGT